eukprot:118600-Pleurochrysis_carterae.AAC.1
MSSPSLGLEDTPRLGVERWGARQVRLERATGAAETYRQPSSADQVPEQLSCEGLAQRRIVLTALFRRRRRAALAGLSSSQVGLCSGGGGSGLDCGAGGAGEESTGAALRARVASKGLTASGAPAAEAEASAVEGQTAGRRRQRWRLLLRSTDSGVWEGG